MLLATVSHAPTARALPRRARAPRPLPRPAARALSFARRGLCSRTSSLRALARGDSDPGSEPEPPPALASDREFAHTTVSSRRDFPNPPRRTYTTLAEKLANNDTLRRNYTIGLKWWTPLSPLDGYSGVADACSRLWENTVLLSGLITSFSAFAVIFPIGEIIHAEGHVPAVYSLCWTLSFVFCATAGFGATILLNKICKCAPQNYSLWFTKFGGFVEIPQLFLYLGGWSAFAGCLVVLTPIYKNGWVTAAAATVFVLCGSLVTAMYSQTTDFEKACARAAERYGGAGSAEATIAAVFDEAARGRRDDREREHPSRGGGGSGGK